MAWCSIAVGALTGLLLSLWSFHGPFPVPPAIGEYDDLSRRLLRLGHIAFFGLGILNILLANHLSGVECDPRRKKLAFLAMNLGNLFLPLTLIAAAFVHPLKYLASLPAMAVTLAVIIGAHAALAAHLGGGRR
ncbi:MAG TPA: hypothetical protein DIU07_10715 [Rhodobacteraceae bacterium]|nr:hypothetical protein [Paracoccaceae bacterium]